MHDHVRKVGVESVLTLLEVLDVAGSEGDADLVDLGSRGRSIDILVLGDVAHLVKSVDGVGSRGGEKMIPAVTKVY